MGKKLEVTDRAYRYRANRTPPAGPRICAFCGNTSTVEVGHVDGHEEHSNPENLIWTCRSCNVRCGNAMRWVGLGRKTRQYNPSSGGAKSLGQWMTAVMAMRGESDDMTVKAAVDMIHATPAEDRSRFAKLIWGKRRKRYGRSGRSDVDDVPF